MHAPLTEKVMNEAASSSHARRADGRGASAFIVSDTSGLHPFDSGLIDDVAARVRACRFSHHLGFGISIGGGGHSAFLSAAAIMSSTVPAARMIFPWPTKPCS